MQFLQHQMSQMSGWCKQAMGHCSFPNYLAHIFPVLNHYHPKWQCTTHHHLHLKILETLIVLVMSHPTITQCPPLYLHHLDRGTQPLPQPQHRVGCHHLTARGIEVLLRPLNSFQNRDLPSRLSAEQVLPAQVVMSSSKLGNQIVPTQLQRSIYKARSVTGEEKCDLGDRLY